MFTRSEHEAGLIHYKSFVRRGKVTAFVCPKLYSDIVFADFQITAHND